MDRRSNISSGDAANFGAVSPDWDRPDRVTIYAADIRKPWKSVYGFPMTAAQLATRQKLMLTCREDEILDNLAQLNTLLSSPESLNRSCDLLEKLAQTTREKILWLVQLQEQPLADSDVEDVMVTVEEILAIPDEQTVADRLANLLTPDDPIREIAEVGKMLVRLRRLTPALDRVKDRGFKVVVINRRRQPQRPNLAARRQQSVPVEGQPELTPARFLSPIGYHLTLWNYLVVRAEGRYSTVWN